MPVSKIVARRLVVDDFIAFRTKEQPPTEVFLRVSEIRFVRRNDPKNFVDEMNFHVYPPADANVEHQQFAPYDLVAFFRPYL